MDKYHLFLTAPDAGEGAENPSAEVLSEDIYDILLDVKEWAETCASGV